MTNWQVFLTTLLVMAKRENTFSKEKILDEVDEKQNPDDIIKVLSFPRAFGIPPGGFNFEDYHNTLIAYTLFQKYGKSPSGNAYILKFFKLINKFVQVTLRDDFQTINHLLEVFFGFWLKRRQTL